MSFVASSSKELISWTVHLTFGNLIWPPIGVPSSSSISCFKHYINMRLYDNRPSQALIKIPSSSIYSKAIFLGKHLRWYDLGQRLQTANCNSCSFLFSLCLQTQHKWLWQLKLPPPAIIFSSSFQHARLLVEYLQLSVNGKGGYKLPCPWTMSEKPNLPF